MPSRDPIKRRAAYKKWAEKNKEKRKSYQHILYIAKKHNPIPQICSIPNCENIGERHHRDYSKPEQVIWICKYHHRRVKHSSTCKICGDKAMGRGLCSKHYKRERSKLEPLFVERQESYRIKWRAKQSLLHQEGSL